MEQVYWYCLAYAAKLHGVLVHAACLMSTHAHEVITDVRGVYPKFLETFHRNLALCTKAYRGWPEEVFNKDSSGAHALLTPDAIVESIAYLIANPVEAGAVRYAKDWPGAHTLPAHVGTRVIKVKRPQHYFDPNNPTWPEELELRLEMPVALELDYGPELARERIAERVRQRQHRAWNKAPLVCGAQTCASIGTHQARQELRSLWEPEPAVCGSRAPRCGDRSGEASPNIQGAVRACPRGVDRRRSNRVLPRRHLVDAGVPRGSVWSRALAPGDSLIPFPRLRDESGAVDVRPQRAPAALNLAASPTSLIARLLREPSRRIHVCGSSSATPFGLLRRTAASANLGRIFSYLLRDLPCGSRAQQGAALQTARTLPTGVGATVGSRAPGAPSVLTDAGAGTP
jgi:hypothetical protein